MGPIMTTVFVMLVTVVMTADCSPLETKQHMEKENENGNEMELNERVNGTVINPHNNVRLQRVKRAHGDCFDEAKWRDRYPYQVHVTDKLPSEIDWTYKLPPVKNQASCGSCWAFAAVGAIEAQSSQNSLSEQCLVDCSTENNGCSGGLPQRAFNFVQKNGIASENAYPYTGKEEICKIYTTEASIKGYYTINTDVELQHAVATIGPVAVGIQVDNNFDQQVENGIVKTCTGDLNHAVLVVGYTTVKNTKVWKIRNSWGANWGSKGYFYITREVPNVCMVSSYASVPIVSTASIRYYHSFLLFLGFVAVFVKQL